MLRSVSLLPSDHSITIGSGKDNRQDGSTASKRFDRVHIQSEPYIAAFTVTRFCEGDRMTLLRPLRKTSQRNKH
jgi:hypothetical protein